MRNNLEALGKEERTKHRIIQELATILWDRELKTWDFPNAADKSETEKENLFANPRVP